MDVVAMVDWSVAVRMTMRVRWAMRVRMSSIGVLIWGVAVQRAAARCLRVQVGRGARLQPRLIDLHVHAVARAAGVPLPQVCLRRYALCLDYYLNLLPYAIIQQLPGLVDLHVHAVARVAGVPLWLNVEI